MNSFKCIHNDGYKDRAIRNIMKNGKEILRSKLAQVLEEANKLLESLEEHDISCQKMSVHYFVKEYFNSKAIPSPKLLIKDHKEIDDDGNYPTRLVVPATNFISAFSKLGYHISINRIIRNKAGINYSRKTIVQASHDLKLQIESIGIREDRHTIFSLDIEAFYPFGYIWSGGKSIQVFLQLLR
jgi:hypothetical protein